MSFVFGPVSSRRFGLSLGIDLSPDRKRCNFDCLYCELAAAKPSSDFDGAASPETIAAEVAERLRSCRPDAITITANGEPTLYPFLDRLISLLEPLKNGAKLMILSNSSTIGDPQVALALARLDAVKLSLDSALSNSFKRVDRPAKTVAPIESIVEAMADFRKRFSGELIVEILLVFGINDSDADFAALAAACRKIRPDRIDIGTIDRPPAYRVKPVADETLRALAKLLEAEGQNARVVKSKRAIARQKFDRAALLALISRRSLSFEESAAILDDESIALLQTLVSQGLIAVKPQGEERFYAIACKRERWQMKL